MTGAGAPPAGPVRPFADVLIERVRAMRTPCVVGIDPEPARISPELGRALEAAGADAPTLAADVLERFALEVIEAVHDLVPAVKPQAAYFERWGAAGVAVLERVVAHARRRGLLVLLDAKRGDIGSTAEAYAAAHLARRAAGGECDALTLNPYLGLDALEPFFRVCERDGKGAFVLVRTSNPGAADLQDLSLGSERVHERVAALIAPRARTLVGRSGFSAIGAVVGATAPEHAGAIRARLPHSIFLVPGLGAQGGDVARARAFCDGDGLGALFSSSRAVLYPQQGAGAPWSREAVRAAALAFVGEVRRALA